jgi:hypothetical protein
MKKILLLLTLCLCFGINSQINPPKINLENIAGFVLSPKDFKQFANSETSILPEILKSKKTQWTRRKKAFGKYAFDLTNDKTGFFVKDVLIVEGEILTITQTEDILFIMGSIIDGNGNKIVIKYVISYGQEDDYDFIVFWYDENGKRTVGEASEKIEIQFIEKEKK